jgi:hypothetical protein
MQTLEGKILSILRSRPSQTGGESNEQSPDSPETNLKVWRMRVSYSGPQSLYEMELREPLKSSAGEKYTVGLNGFVEFELFSEPQIAAGDAIWIDAYEPGEKILG